MTSDNDLVKRSKRERVPRTEKTSCCCTRCGGKGETDFSDTHACHGCRNR